MPEAGLKIAQKGLKNTYFCQNFAEASSLARVWVGYFGFWGGLNPPDPPPTPMYAWEGGGLPKPTCYKFWF